MEYFWFIIIVIIGALLVLILVHLFIDLFGGPMQIMAKNVVTTTTPSNNIGESERFLISAGLEQIFINVLEAFRRKDINKLSEYLSKELLSSIELNQIQIPDSFFVFNRKIAWLSDTTLEVELFGADQHGTPLSEKFKLSKTDNKYLIDEIESLNQVRILSN